MGGARDMIDPRTGAGRRATARDQVLASRVMHHLVNQHQVTSLWQPGDVPDPLEPLYSFLILAWETDKAIGGPGISHPFQARYLTEMAAAVTGADGTGGVYPVDLAFSPVSPLILGREVTEALVDQVRRGGAIVEILPCPAAATTAPGAISAAVAQQNAEVLAGVVLTQAVAPGTPVYYGPRLSAVDPRTGVVVSGTPETGVGSLAAVLLARRYGLACDCYGPCSDSKVVDAQYGYERMANALLGMAARPRLPLGHRRVPGRYRQLSRGARHRRRGRSTTPSTLCRRVRGTRTPSTSRRWSTASSPAAAFSAPSTPGVTSAASSRRRCSVTEARSATGSPRIVAAWSTWPRRRSPD